MEPPGTVHPVRITWFHATDDGGSVFEDLEVVLPRERRDPQDHLIKASLPYASPLVQLTELPADLDQTWHPAPRRQLVTVLTGLLEVVTTDGAARRFGPGNVFLADDGGGKGHLTRAIDGPVQVLFAPMPEDLDLSSWAAG